MKCIYRKKISYEKWGSSYSKFYPATKDEANVIEVEFAECHGKSCPMYADGKCLKALKELDVLPAK